MSGQSTREVLRRTALELFDEQGYDKVTVAAIAKAAAVSHMTFFRHFASKEQVVVEDLFDPAIAAAVAGQPEHLPPLRRAVEGLVAALADPAAGDELTSREFVTRIRLAARTPSLRGAVWSASRDTEDAIARALLVPGVAPEAGRAAAGAVMGAATAALMAWALNDNPTDAADTLRIGLSSLLETGR